MRRTRPKLSRSCRKNKRNNKNFKMPSKKKSKSKKRARLPRQLLRLSDKELSISHELQRKTHRLMSLLLLETALIKLLENHNIRAEMISSNKRHRMPKILL